MHEAEKMSVEEAGKKGGEARAAEAMGEETQMGLKDVSAIEIHLHDDVDYPASKDEVIEALRSATDIDKSDIDRLSELLPDKTFESDEDVVHSAGLKFTLKAAGHKGGETMKMS